MSPKKFLQLKQRVEDLQRQKHQATGALKNLKEQMQKDYACSTVKEAKELLKKLESQIQKLEEQIDGLLSSYERFQQRNKELQGDGE